MPGATTLSALIGDQIARDYYYLIAGIESNHNPNAKNPLSSASGLYQPIRSTWEGLGFDWAKRWDVAEQNRFIEKFTFSNARALMARGCAINFATLYGAHFLGANGLLGVMDDSPSDPITKSTSAAQRKANPSILGETVNMGNGQARRRNVKDFCDWLEKKTGHSVYRNLVTAPAAPLTVEAPKPATEGNAIMNWTNWLVGKTSLQYILVAIGGVLIGKGWVSAADWAEISAGLLLLIPAIFGIKNAATEKAMVGGQVAKIADMTPAMQNAIAREVAAK